MKIIRLSTFLDFGGIESKMVNLSTHKDPENEWVFVAIGKGGQAEKKIHSNGKRKVCLHLNYRIPSFSTVLKLFFFLRSEKPDVLHTSGAEANFFGYFAGKMARVPNIIVEEIGIPSHSSKAMKIFQYIFRNANWATGESQTVVTNITKSFGLNPSKTKVIYNFGIFSYDFSKIQIQKKKDFFHLLMISRLEPIKNIEGVIKVIGKLVREGHAVKLTIAGTGSSEKVLKALIKNLELENFISFIGFINDPYPYLLSSDIYILNSFSEGFSNSLLEAMYSTTPSLSTAVGAAPEIIEDGVNGFLVPSDDEDALYEKLKDILAMTEEKRKQIGIRGHNTIVKNFSLEKHIEKLMEIYQK